MEPGLNSQASEPVPVVPLDYGHADQNGFIRRVLASVRQSFVESCYFWGRVVRVVGGPRQLLFALGLAFVFGTFAPTMALGGFLIGLAYPLPRRS